jgi:hypothetical protein
LRESRTHRYADTVTALIYDDDDGYTAAICYHDTDAYSTYGYAASPHANRGTYRYTNQNSLTQADRYARANAHGNTHTHKDCAGRPATL